LEDKAISERRYIENERRYERTHREQRRAAKRKRYHENREAELARCQQYYLQNKDKRKEYDVTRREKRRVSTALWYMRNGKSPEHQRKQRRNHLLRTYNITEADYLKLLIEQEGACAICRGDQVRRKYFDVDHFDREDGSIQVRGLLCGYCNKALGGFEERPELLRRAAEYLERGKIKSCAEMFGKRAGG
jgi:hypothetical protein